jgi:hypothetical protein
VRGKRRRQRICYRFKNAFGIRQNIVIPQAQNAVALGEEKGIAPFVSRIDRVLPAIDLDNQTALAADKIDDVRTNRLLAHEFAVSQSSWAKMIPEFQFGVGRVAAKAARAIGLGRVCTAHVVKCPSPGSSKLSFDDPTSPRKRGEVYLYHGSMPNSVPVRCPSPDALRASTSPRTRVEVSYFLRNARADAHELGYKAL